MKMEGNTDLTKDALKSNIYSTYDEKINELYKFRDTYYITNVNSTNPEDRNLELTRKLNEISTELESVENEFESKASYLTLVGRAFNVLPEYNQKAFDSLTKAV
jgi:regulator of sigma D